MPVRLHADERFVSSAYSSYQRGSGEYANLLLRWFFPKGTDFSGVSAEGLQWAEDLTNDRPMKLHGWQTRRQVHALALAASRASTGLRTARPDPRGRAPGTEALPLGRSRNASTGRRTPHPEQTLTRNVGVPAVVKAGDADRVAVHGVAVTA